MIKTILLSIVASLIVCCGSQAQGQSHVLVNVAPGYSDTSVNTSIFRNNSVVSHGDWQFVSFYDTEGQVTIAKRQLGSDQWEINHTQYTGHVTDGHNVISMMVDGDGYLHVAFDHHGSQLNYCRSVEPLSIELGALMPMVGREEEDVTYPEFYRLVNGDLIFVYRSGASGCGNMVMNSYNTSTREWKRLHDVLIDGENERNAYWQLCVDVHGTIHVSWVWRETYLVETNHDMCYARSHDGGHTWEKSTGEKYELPITAATAEYAWRIPQNSELMNQTRMVADADGNPYIATYWRDANSDVPQYRIVWADQDGWHASQVGNRSTPFSLAGGGTKMVPIARPCLAIDGKKAYYLVRDVERGSKVSIGYSEDIRTGNWWFSDLTDFSVGAWEPSYDSELWKNKQELDIFVQATRQGDGEKTIEGSNEPVWILHLDRSAFGRHHQQVFSVVDPDYESSPYTGMTRQHWVAAAKYMLDGAFGYVNRLDDPMYFPKQLEKAYPRDSASVQVAKLEGMCRTFFLASHLLRENPELSIRGIKMRDYYKHQILNLITPGTDSYLPSGPNGPSQTLIEHGALCLSLKVAEHAVWNEFTQEQKDSLAAMLRQYGEGPTIDTNWRFFNVFILAFLKDQGYYVNDEYYEHQLTKLLERYRGEGWYNDAPAYDYYSMWAFQTYGPLWAEFYGKHFPELAAQFLSNQEDLVDNYPYMFSRDGRMNMWGRSIPYRFGSVAPFSALAYGNNSDIDYGWLRMISSATLLQFLGNPDFMSEGVPSLGFYGAFAPAVQVYSCRGSVYWCGKAFFNLLLPEDHPYWAAQENQGPWEEKLEAGKVYNKFQPSTNLMITNYPNCGGSEMRSWCHERVADDWQQFRSSENYNKLAYHTEFPWMADAPGGVVSMNYATLNANNDWEVLRLYDFVSFENGVYTRRAVLENDPEVSFQLNDIPLPDGVLRIDKVTASGNRKIHLGSYSLPQRHQGINDEVRELPNGQKAFIMTNGQYGMATIPLHGWSDTQVLAAENVHPESQSCSLILNSGEVNDEQIFITLDLWNKGPQPFTDSQLSTIKSLSVGLSQVSITLNSGDVLTVSFDN